MTQSKQNRLRSPIFWSALSAQMISLLVLTGLFDPGWSEVAENISCTVLELLVAVGLLNNPTDKGGF